MTTHDKKSRLNVSGVTSSVTERPKSDAEFVVAVIEWLTERIPDYKYNPYAQQEVALAQEAVARLVGGNTP